MQTRIIITFLFSIISLIGFGQADRHHRTYESSLNDTIFNHMESTTSTGEVISIGFRQFETDKQTLVLVTLDAKGNIKWQKEIDFGRDTTKLLGLAKIDLNSTKDSILFVCVLEGDEGRKNVIGRCAKDGSNCTVSTVEGLTGATDIPNIASFIDSTEILLSPAEKPTISRIGLGNELLWSRKYNFNNASGTPNQTTMVDIVGTIDSTIVLADDGLDGSFFLAELDSNGVQLWAENYLFQVPGMIDPYPRQVIKLNNMSTAVVGLYGTGNTDENGFVMVVDTFGSPLFAREIIVDGNSTDMKNILQVEDGSLWLSGTYIDNDSSYYFTTNMSINGALNWTTIYPGIVVGNEPITPDFTSLRPVDIGGAFLAGHAIDDAGLTMLNVMKHNDMGETPCSDTISVTLIDISVTTDTLFSEETIENGGIFFNTIEVELKGTNILSPPTLSILDAYQFCPNEPIDTVLIAIVGGVSEITYQWGDENGTLPEFNDSLRIIKEGQYSVTVTIGEDVCYQMCDTIEVARTNLPVPMVFAEDMSFCSNGDVLFRNELTVTVDQGQPPFEFIWSNNMETSESITVELPGTYTVTVTDACGDMVSANGETVDPDIPPPMPIINILDTTACSQTLIVFDGQGQTPFDYIWSTGETSESINVIEDGNYLVTVTDQCNKTASTSINVIIPISVPQIFIEQINDTFCISNGVILSAIYSGGGNDLVVEWTDKDGNVVEPFLTEGLNTRILALSEGDYSISIEDECGNITTNTFDVNFPDREDECANEFSFPQVFFPRGTEDTEMTFGPIPSSSDDPMFIDTMQVLDRISDIEFKVFNRWGEEVYSIDSQDNSAFLMPWDGTHKGDPAPSEVYIYYFSYRLDKDINPEAPTLIKKGDITLVR